MSSCRVALDRGGRIAAFMAGAVEELVPALKAAPKHVSFSALSSSLRSWRLLCYQVCAVKQERWAAAAAEAVGVLSLELSAAAAAEEHGAWEDLLTMAEMEESDCQLRAVRLTDPPALL